MQYSIVGNDIALIMHYRALLKRSGVDTQTQNSWTSVRGMQYMLEVNMNTKIADDLVHKLPYKCYRIYPLVLWPCPEDFEKLAYSEELSCRQGCNNCFYFVPTRETIPSDLSRKKQQQALHIKMVV